MDEKFDPFAHVTRVGRNLISSFEGAGSATTPGQVGSAAEVPVRKQLENLLPRGIGVGTGFVIDSYGGTSRQMDVILYEKEYCPTFCVNEDPSTTYFPCEGVIAVGEIKTSIASRELKDSFAKVLSAKKLRRFLRSENPNSGNPQNYSVFRKYGSNLSTVGTPTQKYDQEQKPLDQIFGFVLAGCLEVTPQTICANFAQLATEYETRLSPNMVVTMDGSILCPLTVPDNRHNPVIEFSLQDANGIYCVEKPEGSFPFLLSRISSVFSQGRSVEVSAFERYFIRDGNLTLPSDGVLVDFP